MKTIEVSMPTSYTEELSVMIYDECNHAGAEIEDMEYSVMEIVSDTGGRYAPTGSETIPTLVCKCGFEEQQEPSEPDYDRDEDY